MAPLKNNALLTSQPLRYTETLWLTFKSVKAHFGVISWWWCVPQAWCGSSMNVRTTKYLAMATKHGVCFNKALELSKLSQSSVYWGNWPAYYWRKIRHYTTTSFVHKKCPEGSNMRGKISQNPCWMRWRWFLCQSATSVLWSRETSTLPAALWSFEQSWWATKRAVNIWIMWMMWIHMWRWRPRKPSRSKCPQLNIKHRLSQVRTTNLLLLRHEKSHEIWVLKRWKSWVYFL